MNNLNSLNNINTIPTGVIEPLFEYIYEKNEKSDFASIVTLSRVCLLWNAIIHEMPRYKTNENKFNNILVLKSDRETSIGILGIGYKLTAEHTGQYVFRCAPLGDDWSYTPVELSEKFIHVSLNKLIGMTQEHFKLEFTFCLSHELNRSDYDDENWILRSDLQKFISTYPLNGFKSEIRNHTSFDDRSMDIDPEGYIF